MRNARLEVKILTYNVLGQLGAVHLMIEMIATVVEGR
jgi:mRNA deadenylase 3'-5' endonuclease subunit Ccr4